MNKIPRKILSEEKEKDDYSKSENLSDPELRPTARKYPPSIFSPHPSTATTVTGDATLDGAIYGKIIESRKYDDFGPACTVGSL